MISFTILGIALLVPLNTTDSIKSFREAHSVQLSTGIRLPTMMNSKMELLIKPITASVDTQDQQNFHPDFSRDRTVEKKVLNRFFTSFA